MEFQIDPAEAVEFLKAVGLLWATAWIFRQLRKVIK